MVGQVKGLGDGGGGEKYHKEIHLGGVSTTCHTPSPLKITIKTSIETKSTTPL